MIIFVSRNSKLDKFEYFSQHRTSRSKANNIHVYNKLFKDEYKKKIFIDVTLQNTLFLFISIRVLLYSYCCMFATDFISVKEKKKKDLHNTSLFLSEKNHFKAILKFCTQHRIFIYAKRWYNKNKVCALNNNQT